MALAAAIQILKDDATVGGLVADRIYFGVAPIDQAHTLPFVVGREISNLPSNNKDESKLDQVRVQFDCYSTEMSDPAGAGTVEISEAIRAALEYTAEQTINGETLQQIRLDNWTDIPPDADLQLHQRAVDFIIRQKL